MLKRLLPLLLVGTALPAFATTTFYVGPSGETQFGLDLLTRGLTAGGLVNFAGVTSGTTIFDVGGTGVNFTGSNSLNLDVSAITLIGSAALLQIALPNDVYAIGFHVMGLSSDKTWTYGPAGGTTVLNSSTITFIGAISTTPLASLPTLTLTGPGSTTGVTVLDFKIGTAGSVSETPEPSTMAMVGSGLILFPLIARRRKRKS
jgi:hypothetical protein